MVGGVDMRDISDWSFADDMNKMHDFMTMGMKEFFYYYSYINEDDYFATYHEIMLMLKAKYPYMEFEEV